MSVKRLAIIQARMTSSRLPGKVLLDIAGQPMLQRMLERVQEAKSLDALVVATTTDPTDDVLAQFCRQQDIPCYRGSLQDVLDRCYQAAVRFHADAVIRLTADCPLIDPEILDRTVAILTGSTTFQEPQPGSITPETNPGALLSNPPSPAPIDFAADRLPPPWKRSLPIGLDVEVCRFEALQRAWQEAREPYQREHVLPYLYEGVTFEQSTVPHGIGWYVQHGTTPRGFKVALLNHTPDYGSLRWTVDTPADLEFVRQVFARFEGDAHFTWQDVLNLLGQEPALAAINADVKHKSAFDIDHRLGN